ncbi:MAG TPA: DUF3574 domain-containing protein [Acetobacteraceae bacterium]|nr:DUF3574 domain-containing protein [Acetobacteraceae bacterium]
MPPCSVGSPTLVADLFFGRSLRGGGAVSDADWSDFLAREVTPRFPDGLTIVSAQGQWRPRNATAVIREESWLVIIATDPGPATDQRFAAIRAAYQARFHQESVGLVTTTGCALF